MLFDTSAWIEFFKGTDKGAKVKDILENQEVYTSAISLAEITKWCVESGLDISVILSHVRRNSIIIEVEDDILIRSGEIYGELRKISSKISLIDVIIYVSATTHGLFLLTTDTDFRKLPMVEML